MSTIALIDTRLKIPLKDHVPTKIVTLKVRLGDGEHVNPGVHLFWRRGKNQGRGEE